MRMSFSGDFFGGIVVIYDIMGFTRFFNQPDVYNYAPRYLNAIGGVISDLLEAREADWLSENPYGPHRWDEHLLHRKFMGDGELLVFGTPKGESQTQRIKSLIHGIFCILRGFDTINARIRDEIPVADLPTGLRFSMSRGTIMKLVPDGGDREPEYIGFPITLASRLQSHCRGIRFIASGKVGPRKIRPDASEYVTMKTRGLKDFPPELVLLDAASYHALDAAEREALFEEL